MTRWLFCLFSWGTAIAGSQDSLQKAYIERYGDLARQHMVLHRIPASITMAQALLESAAGTSPLAIEANNHFGIKCGKGWVGDSIHVDDDRPQDCFRKYAHPDSSYADRVAFLARPRYRFLFDSLSSTDYKAWAYGLKRAGYATDTLYPLRLISLIERLNLQSLDQLSQEQISLDSAKGGEMAQAPVLKFKKNIDFAWPQAALQKAVDEGIVYVTQEGDGPLTVSQQTGVPLYKLQAYNQLELNVPLFPAGRVLVLNRNRYRKLQETLLK
ncbi:MAG: glycoside hydrolase family 73 protein [Bacteroidota bacterium]